MIHNEYVERLEDAIKLVENGHLFHAKRLSDEIHKFEERGGELSDKEDKLWLRLTELLEA